MYTISKDGFGGADHMDQWTNNNGKNWLNAGGNLGDLVRVLVMSNDGNPDNLLVKSLNDRLAKLYADFHKDYEFTYDAKMPQAISCEVNLGDGDTKADQIAIAIDNELLDSDTYQLVGNKVTIFPEALKNLRTGVYSPAVIFNDSYYTTAANRIKINVINYEEPQDTVTEDQLNALTDDSTGT